MNEKFFHAFKYVLLLLLLLSEVTSEAERKGGLGKGFDLLFFQELLVPSFYCNVLTLPS